MNESDAVVLHREAIVFDGLIIANWSPEVIEDMRRGGLTGANCTCSVWEGLLLLATPGFCNLKGKSPAQYLRF